MTVKDGARRLVGLTSARGAIAVLFAWCGVTAGATAHAHPEFASMGTNRYVTAAVFDGRVDVTDAWLHGALTAVELRRSVDANRDGRIDPAERQAAEEKLRAEGPLVTVELDGHPATAPLSVAIDLGDDPRVGPSPVVVERRMRLSRAADAPETRVRLAVTGEPPRVLETELSIVLGPGLTLTGPDRAHFDGARRSSLETRAATFTVTAASPKRRKPLLGVVAVALGAAAIGLLWRWQRQRNETPRRQGRQDLKKEEK